MGSRLASSTVILVAAACTYAAPDPLVRVANHVRRAGTDSVAIAVHVAELRRPTGLAAFPDGGKTRLDHEHAIFYLCAMDARGAAASVRRVASIPRPASIRSAFTPWLSTWDGPSSVIASLRGYATVETTADGARTEWMLVRLTGEIERMSSVFEPPRMGVAESLPPVCETAVVADAGNFLASMVARR